MPNRSSPLALTLTTLQLWSDLIFAKGTKVAASKSEFRNQVKNEFHNLGDSKYKDTEAIGEVIRCADNSASPVIRFNVIWLLKAYRINFTAERWVRNVKEECLSKLVLFGEESLFHALKEYVANYHEERNHQGRDNVILFPASNFNPVRVDASIECRERLGGLLKKYYRKAS